MHKLAYEGAFSRFLQYVIHETTIRDWINLRNPFNIDKYLHEDRLKLFVKPEDQMYHTSTFWPDFNTLDSNYQSLGYICGANRSFALP